MLSGKRILGAFLALILLFPAWLQTDSLAEPLVWDGSVDISWYAEGETAFTLTTPAQLAGLAALVNGRTDEKVTKGRITGDASLLVSYSHEGTELTGSGGGNTSDTTYMSAIDFAGVTISLGADMDMGGVYDTENKTWSGPNWTPIGGKYPLDTTTSGDCLLLDTRFNGVLDGQGHIRSRTCTATVTLQRALHTANALGLWAILAAMNILFAMSTTAAMRLITMGMPQRRRPSLTRAGCPPCAIWS